MMDHKKIIMKGARAQILMMISDIDEQRKQELYEQYKTDVPVTISETNQTLLIGNWHNNAAKMLLRGATEEELKPVAEHILVLIGARKHNLDFKKSYKDRDLLSLTRKYFNSDEKVEIKVSEKRKEIAKDKEAYRKAVEEKAQALRAEGLSNAEVAERLKVPESTIRMIMNRK